MKGQMSEDVIRRCGGRFKMSVLLQKRMREYFLSYSRQTTAPSLERAMTECAGGDIWLEKPAAPVPDEDASDEEDEASDDES